MMDKKKGNLVLTFNKDQYVEISGPAIIKVRKKTSLLVIADQETDINLRKVLKENVETKEVAKD